MKKTLFKIQCLGLTLATLICGNNLSAQNFGQFASAVFMTVNGTPTTYNVVGSGPNLIGPSGQFFIGLGTYDRNSGNLLLNGSEVKSYKNNGANVCGVDLYYRVTSYGNNNNPFNVMNLPYKAGCSGGIFTDGFGPCSGNDQKWSTQSYAIDLTQFDPGQYIVEVYFKMKGSSNDPSACDETLNLSWNNTSGALTRAMFYIRDTTVAQRNNMGTNLLAQENGATIRTYPSPVSNIVTIETSNFENGPIFNATGALIYHHQSANAKMHQIPVDGFANGIYNIRIATDKGFVNRTFQILR